jgi:acyl carrier protein
VTLTFDEFARVLAEYFCFDDTDISADSELRNDLAFDSLQVYELVAVIETLSDGLITESQIDQVVTIGDAHFVYQQFRDRSDLVTGSVDERK